MLVIIRTDTAAPVEVAHKNRYSSVLIFGVDEWLSSVLGRMVYTVHVMFVFLLVNA